MTNKGQTLEVLRKNFSKLKKEISNADWPEYLRKLGFPQYIIDRCLQDPQLKLYKHWTKLSGTLCESQIEILKLVKQELHSQSRNEKIDELYLKNGCNALLKGRNLAWFMYDFLRIYPGKQHYMEIVRKKFKLNEEQVQPIENNHSRNYTECKYQMMWKWINIEEFESPREIASSLMEIGLEVPDTVDNLEIDGILSEDLCCIGDLSYTPDSSESEDEMTIKEEKEMRSLKKACRQSFGSTMMHNEPLPLQVTRQEDISKEEFGNISSWTFKHQTSKKLITPENLFDEAAKACDDSVNVSFEPVNEQHWNIVGLTGIAGIGKTTFCRQVKKIWTEKHPEAFVFFILVRDLDFTKQYNVLKFLLASTCHNYMHKKEKDDLILQEINKARNTLVVIDGVDEAGIACNFSKYPTGMSLYEDESAYTILMNLANCRLFPNARKLIASRPNAFLQFNPYCKPVFMAQVLGLNTESQLALCKQICKTEEQQKRVQEELQKQTNVSSLCFIPMFGRMIIRYIGANLDSNKPIVSLTDVFVMQLVQWQMHPRFHVDSGNLKKLAKLAFFGVEQRRFEFDSNKLKEHDLQVASIEPFMCAHTKKTQIPGLLILDGCKVYFFIHATWQEFLAALYLMLFAPFEDFSNFVHTNLNGILQLQQGGHWEIVVHYLFGFCHPDIEAKLQMIFTDSQSYRAKQGYLKTQLSSVLPTSLALPSNIDFALTEIGDIDIKIKAAEFMARNNDSILWNICSWACESGDKSMIARVADTLPTSIFLVQEILPSEIMCFCEVLRASKKQHTLIIGCWLVAATFSGTSLQTLLEYIKHSSHELKELHVRNSNVDNLSPVLDVLPNLHELTLRDCEMLCGDTQKLFNKLTSMVTDNLSYIDLSGHDLHGMVKPLVKSLPVIRTFRLSGCNLQDEDFKSISEFVLNDDTSLDLLTLSNNKISKSSLNCLAPCVHKANWIQLDGCSIEGDFLEPVCNEISKRNMPMKVFNLGDNDIGNIGVSHLAMCVYNMNELWLGDCGLNGSELQPLFTAIHKREHKMTLLNIGGNQIGSENVPMLAKCVHYTEAIMAVNCGLNGEDASLFSDEIRTCEQRFKWLSLSHNAIGDSGARALEGCLKKLKFLSVKGCGITSEGGQALVKAGMQWESKVRDLTDSTETDGYAREVKRKTSDGFETI